jgi:ABC-2 type transport system ATP-binding protein
LVRQELSSQIAVDARDVAFSYGDRRALAGVSFQIPEAQIFGFLGPNGGGKTTLFRILATLLSSQSGSIRVLGSDLAREASLIRLQIGVVFQEPSLDPHLTVLENLIHQGYFYGLRGQELRQRCEDLLTRFRLDDRRGDRVSTLSGGMKRRVEICKSLLHRPRLLLLDEPSSGLDPGARRDLWTVLDDLRATQDVTVLLTTHFIEEGDRCDRLALVDSGRIVALGRPETLKQEIGGDVVVLSSAEAESLGEQLANRFGLEVTVHGDVVRFEHSRAHELVGDLIAFSAGRIQALTISKPTLEDVFLRRTGHGLWEEGGE